MIQRRQTIYLLLIAVISAGMLYFDPVFYRVENAIVDSGETVNISVGYRSRTFNDDLTRPNQGLIYLIGVIGLISLSSIFMFRNRPLQRRITIINFVVMVLLLAGMYAYSINSHYLEGNLNEAAGASFLYPAVIPLGIVYT